MVFHGVDGKKQFKRMRELAPDAYKAFLEFDGKAFAPGALPLKTKELIALGIAHVTQCPWCIDAHARRARKAGASDVERIATVNVQLLPPPVRLLGDRSSHVGGVTPVGKPTTRAAASARDMVI